MTLARLAYLSGVLTIVSPCILPVLPFVLARAEGRLLRTGLPLLAGMALTFAAVVSFAAVAGGWAVLANQYGRVAALSFLALFGVALIFPTVSGRLTQALVALGVQPSRPGNAEAGPSVFSSVLLRAATDLLWAPCAGPVLGLILTGAARQGASVGTSLLLLAYAAVTATPVAVPLLASGRVFAAIKCALGAGAWVWRGLGAAVLAAVAAVALGLDTGNPTAPAR